MGTSAYPVGRTHRAFDGTASRRPRRPTGTAIIGTGMLLGREIRSARSTHRLVPPMGPVTGVACDSRGEPNSWFLASSEVGLGASCSRPAQISKLLKPGHYSIMGTSTLAAASVRLLGSLHLYTGFKKATWSRFTGDATQRPSRYVLGSMLAEVKKRAHHP